MDTKNYGPPEEFVAAPLLVLVPGIGKVGLLESSTSSLYARYEKICLVLKEAEKAGQTKELQRSQRERAMLAEVLDWLAVSPDEALE